MHKLSVLAERSVEEARMARAEVLHEFERDLQTLVAETHEGVTCSKGCDSCCHHPLSISLLEGISLYRWLVDNHLWSASRREQLEKHSDVVWGLAPEVWLLSMIACPLLKDKHCEAYKGRPAVCRATIATGDPYYCHPHRFGLTRTRLLPRHKFYNSITSVEGAILARHNQVHLQLPLSTAVLYGERVSKGELALEDTGRAMALAYQKQEMGVRSQ